MVVAAKNWSLVRSNSEIAGCPLIVVGSKVIICLVHGAVQNSPDPEGQLP